MQNSANARVPVSFVTGFLGSGKTTLISALLRHPDMTGTAVVVNEFGEVGLDDAIFADSSEQTDIRLLANGCMCCVAGDDLCRTLLELIRAGTTQPSRIIIETTGVADPANLMRMTMADLRLRPKIRMEGVVATADAVNGMANLDEHEVCRVQAAIADTRVITKTDLAGSAELAVLEDRLRSLNPGGRVIQADFGNVDPGDLFAMSLVDPRTGQSDLKQWLRAEQVQAHRAEHDGPTGGTPYFSADHTHGDKLGTWLLEEGRPVDWERLEPRIGEIIKRRGDMLLRLKGVVRTAGDDRPLVLHGVQRIFHAPVRLGKWQGPPASTIVAIGGDDAQLAVEELKSAFASCVVATQAAAG